jgi:hypothetical protein
MVVRITEALDAGDGVIKSRRGSATINELVDKAFNALDRAGLNDFYKAAVADIFTIIGNNDLYSFALATDNTNIGDKRYKSIRQQVDRIMRGKLGIDDKGRVKPNGELGKLFKSDAIRTAVKEALNAGIASGKPSVQVGARDRGEGQGYQAIARGVRKGLDAVGFRYLPALRPSIFRCVRPEARP